MKAWILRTVGIYALSVGIVFLVFPFHDYREESVERNTIEAKRIGFVEQDDNTGVFRTAWNLDRAGTSPVPSEFLEALDSLDRGELETNSASILAPIRVLMNCLPPEEILSKTGSDYLVRRGPILYRVRNSNAAFWKMMVKADNSIQPEGEGRLTVSIEGRIYPPDAGWNLDPGKLGELPGLAAVFEENTSGRYSIPELPKFDEWKTFATSNGGTFDSNDQSRAILDGEIFQVEPVVREGTVRIPVPRLRLVSAIAGAILALAGLALLFRRENRQTPAPGAIRVGTTGGLLAGTIVIVIFTSLAVIPPADALLNRLFHTEPIANESFILFMGIFLLLLAVPLVALYLSMLNAQWIQVSDSGVHLHSLFSDKSLAWGQVEEVAVDRGTPVPTVRAGMPLPRTLQKTLALLGGGQRIGIMETSETRKQEIVQALVRNAPTPLQDTIRTAGDDWLGYEAW